MVGTPCAFLVAFAVAVGCGLQPFGNANPSPMADFLGGLPDSLTPGIPGKFGDRFVSRSDDN